MNEKLPTPTQLDPIEEAIFNAAAELGDPDLRRSFLDRTCGGACPLRARLQELLAAEAQANEFLADDPLQLSPPPRRHPSPPPTPPEGT